MTDCPNGDIRDQLPDYVHDRLNAADRARVAAHVASCPSCAVEIKLLDTARRVLTAAAPSIDTARIVATLPSPPRAVPRPAIVRSARGVELGVEPGVERGSSHAGRPSVSPRGELPRRSRRSPLRAPRWWSFAA